MHDSCKIKPKWVSLFDFCVFFPSISLNPWHISYRINSPQQFPERTGKNGETNAHFTLQALPFKSLCRRLSFVVLRILCSRNGINQPRTDNHPSRVSLSQYIPIFSSTCEQQYFNILRANCIFFMCNLYVIYVRLMVRDFIFLWHDKK